MINGEEYTQFRDHMILPSTTGFFKPTPEGFRSKGTGTFVSMGKIKGILTCAHVLKAIKDEKRIVISPSFL
jgi:hypothetical protein